MNFSEYQDAVLAGDIKPCKNTEAISALGAAQGRSSPERVIKLLGIVLREVAAIATERDLDLAEIAEASFRNNDAAKRSEPHV